MRERRGGRRATGGGKALRLIEGGRRSASRDVEAEPAGGPLVVAAREEVRRRADRRLVLGPDLLAEPAWDMMLDLYLAAETGHRVSVSSLCVAAGIPTTTALRWIRMLEVQQLLVRERDPVDARRSFVALSPVAREKIELLLRRSIGRRPAD